MATPDLLNQPVQTEPTGFLEEFCQDVIVRFLLTLCLRLFFLIGPFLHQVRDVVALKAGVLAAFASLVLVFVGVSLVAVLSFLPAFLRAGQRRA